jgi:hypothetical protein
MINEATMKKKLLERSLRIDGRRSEESDVIPQNPF